MRIVLHKLLKKLWESTHRSSVLSQHMILGLCCMLIAAFLVLCLPAGETLAASGLKIYDYSTKKQTTYQDAQVKVTFNGKKISKDSTPGILVNGIALVSYKDIFANSTINAACSYNKAKGTVTISKYGTTIVMKLGSLKGTVNGKAVTLPVAPVKIKYIADNVTKILVPSRFVCQNLGLEYTWNSKQSTVAITKEDEDSKATINSLSLSYDNGSKFSYTGAQGAVMIDGEYISLGNMPSIINSNTAMLRAKRVFADSLIDADYSYDEKSKTLTLATNGRVLVMTIGSTTAYLNGTKINLDRAPMIVYNHDVKTSYVMVPGNNTASSLGLTYTWNNSKLTSVITTNQNSANPEQPGNSGNTAPELGDSGMTATGLILNEWKADAASKSTGMHVLNGEMDAIKENGQIYLVARDYTKNKSNVESYMILSDTPFEKVTTTRIGQQLKVTAQNKKCMDYVYQIYGTSGNFVNTIMTAYRQTDTQSVIDFNMLPENFSYDISLSEDKLTLYVTFTINSITGITIGTNEQGDYLTLSGVDPLKVIVTEQSGMLALDIPYTVSEIGDLNTAITGAKYLNLMYKTQFQQKTQILLGKASGAKYVYTKEGNRFTILLYGAELQPPVTVQPDGGNSTEPLPQPDDATAIIDKSKYEIIIPKALGITKAQITDFDDYFNNRFSIKLPGDQTGFLSQNPLTVNSLAIKDISVFLNNNNETEIRITTNMLQGYEYVTDENNIYINIGNPREIYPNIVVLDPGHGGPANGAHYFGMDEKYFNLKILYEMGAKYFNSDPSRLKVYYTRETDVDMTLANRAGYASKMGADLFVSLHMNASTASGAYGTEVYYSNNNNSPNAAGLTSKKMAEIFVNKLTEGLGTSNRGAKAEKYTVVHKNTVPAVLIELGFLSNKNDFAKISDPTFQDNTARLIYQTLLQIFEQYPTGR